MLFMLVSGVHTWSDGKVYSGHFDTGKECGFGTLSHPDGVKYRGQFRRGAKDGYGIMLWKTRTYDGEWYVFHESLENAYYVLFLLQLGRPRIIAFNLHGPFF